MVSKVQPYYLLWKLYFLMVYSAQVQFCQLTVLIYQSNEQKGKEAINNEYISFHGLHDAGISCDSFLLVCGLWILVANGSPATFVAFVSNIISLRKLL